jgi:hypothetical protein
VRAVAGAALVLALLTVVQTWPLATDPAVLSRNNNGDTILNEWIVSWVVHQLARDPLHLFDANIFYPERHTLAYSEPLIVPALFGMPMRALGASPVLTYNLLLLLGFFLTALAMYGVMFAWTGDHVAAVFAGALLAFNAHTMTRLPHLQAIHAAGVPLAFWALDRVITSARSRDALWLALFVITLALTSGYTAIVLAFGLLAALLARAPEWLGRRAPSVLGRLALSALVTTVVVVPILWPYREVHALHGLTRSLDDVSQYSASPWSYLITTARLHYDLWSRHLYQVVSFEVLFPGAVATALSAVAMLMPGGPSSRARIRMALAVAAIGFVLSLGPSTPVYGWMYRLFPPMEGLRAAARFGYLVLFAVAVLGGFGLAALRARWAGRRWVDAASAAVIAIASVEAFHTHRFQEYRGIPEIYQRMAQDTAPGAVVEVPFYSRSDEHQNTRYMLASTVHWRPLLNGYSGFRPASFARLAELMDAFPEPQTIDALRARNVRYIVLHTGDFRRSERAREVQAALDQRPDVQLVESDQRGRRLYRLLAGPGAS